ncbi:MAG: hypothetical protein ABR987_01965 [Terracidiphilus sp.]|jgi:hypothetical protein
MLLFALLCVGMVWLFVHEATNGDFSPRKNPGLPGMLESLFQHPAFGWLVALILVGIFASYFKLWILGFFRSIQAATGSARARVEWARYSLSNHGKLPLETFAWVYARAQFTPYYEVGRDFVRWNRRLALEKYGAKLSPEMRSLLQDLQWVDGFVGCMGDSWLLFKEDFEVCGADRPAVLDFVARIKLTGAAAAAGTNGEPLLRWIAERTPKSAPQLRKALIDAYRLS